MDIERLKNNREYEFHDRVWDDQTQIVLYYQEQSAFRIVFWDYYFANIFDQAELGIQWTGFTRDYHAVERTLDFRDEPIAIGDLDEYLNDLYTNNERIANNNARRERECFRLICDFLAYAKETGMTVMVDEEI